MNPHGAFQVNRAIVRGMVERDHDRIVSIASIGGKDGNPNAAAYSAFKAALIAMTKGLDKETATRNVAVNAMTPAVVAHRRVGGVFANAPALKERGVDVSVAVWRGLAGTKTTPQPVVDVLADVARRVGEDAGFRETLARAELGFAYADAAAFQQTIDRDRAFCKELVPKLVMK
nr:SDR family NAD(P)-dependent oxidoreductase [Variovorax boronicumulans]